MAGFTPMQVTLKGLLKVLNQAKDAGYVTVGEGGAGGGTIGDGTKMVATEIAPGQWEFTVNSSTPPGGVTPTTVTIPAAKVPTRTDGPGTNADFVTLHLIPGIKWRVQAPETSAGVEYSAGWFGGASQKDAPVTTGGYAEVTAVAEEGYVLSGVSSWSFTFTNVANVTNVTIPAGSIPTAQDLADMANDTVTLTKVTGVTWVVDGVEHPSSAFSGTTKVVPYNKGVDVTVAAIPASSEYAISGTSSWVLPFTNVPAAAGGWTPVYPAVTFAGMADETLAVGRVIGGDGTTTGFKVSSGGAKIASEMLLLDLNVDRKVALLGGVDRNKLRASITLKSAPDAFERHRFFFHGATNQGTEMGVVFKGTSAYLVADPSMSVGIGTASGTGYAVKVNDRITIEWDGPTKTVSLLINGSKVGSLVASAATAGNVKNAMIYTSSYSAVTLTVDDLLLESWV